MVTRKTPIAEAPGTEPGRSAAVRRGLSLLLVIVAAIALPLGLRGVNGVHPTGRLAKSYLPAVFPPRERAPFQSWALDGFRKTAPAYVVIGDSMAGSRIDHRLLGRLLNALVVPVYEAASGPAYWYLAYKNWVVAAGVHPKAVIFFFRDNVLTDPMFRLKAEDLDRAALEDEPELNEIVAPLAQGPWFRVHAWLRDAYQFDRTRQWIEPALVRAPVSLAARPGARRRLLDRMNREIFSLEGLRPMAAADLADEDLEKLDFQKAVQHSVLPAILRLARQSNTRAAFIRVQRRPSNNQPPSQSPALRKYTRQLKAYLEANGAYFHDEWGDPELPLAIYGDGDHIRRDAKAHTTELLVRRNPGLFR